MAMLKVSHLPTAAGIARCWSHQTDNFIISKVNNQADEIASAAAFQGPDSPHHIREHLHYNPHPTVTPHLTNSNSVLSTAVLHPNRQPLAHFVKTHLQPTPKHLHFLRTITASCKICQMSGPPNPDTAAPPFPTLPRNWLASWLYPHAHCQMNQVPPGLSGYVLRVGGSIPNH